MKAQSSKATRSVRCLLLLETKSFRVTRSLLLLLETKIYRAIRSLCHPLLLLKSQSSHTPRGKGRVLLRLKTKTSRTPWGICHLLLHHLRPALIELLHNSWFMRLLRIVHPVAFFISG
jgi:hypothetical protein